MTVSTGYFVGTNDDSIGEVNITIIIIMMMMMTRIIGIEDDKNNQD